MTTPSPYANLWFAPLAQVYLRRGWKGAVLEEDAEAFQRKSWTRGGSRFWKPLADAIRAQSVDAIADAIAMHREGDLDPASARRLVLQTIAQTWRDAAEASRSFELDRVKREGVTFIEWEAHSEALFPRLCRWVWLHVAARVLDQLPEPIPELDTRMRAMMQLGARRLESIDLYWPAVEIDREAQRLRSLEETEPMDPPGRAGAFMRTIPYIRLADALRAAFFDALRAPDGTPFSTILSAPRAKPRGVLRTARGAVGSARRHPRSAAGGSGAQPAVRRPSHRRRHPDGSGGDRKLPWRDGSERILGVDALEAARVRCRRPGSSRRRRAQPSSRLSGRPHTSRTLPEGPRQVSGDTGRPFLPHPPRRTPPGLRRHLGNAFSQARQLAVTAAA